VAAGAVVTGGTSLLNGLDFCSARALGLNTVVGQNPDWVTEELSGPKYSTALGLLQYALTGARRAFRVAAAPKGLMGSIRKYSLLSDRRPERTPYPALTYIWPPA